MIFTRTRLNYTWQFSRGLISASRFDGYVVRIRNGVGENVSLRVSLTHRVVKALNIYNVYMVVVGGGKKKLSKDHKNK